MSKPPPAGPAPWRVVGYDLELRPCRGWWSKYEGRVVQLVEASPGESRHCHQVIPRGAGYNRPAAPWMRSRNRERLRRRLIRQFNERHAALAPGETERTRLVHTMAGWQ